MDQVVVGNSIGGPMYEMGSTGSNGMVPKKSSLKKRSAASIRFESSLLGNSRSSQSLTNLAATSGTGFTLNTAHNHLNSMGAAGLTPSSTSNTRKRPHGGGCSKPVEIVHFHLKGGPPWGFRIKQREENVNCGGRGHKGGLRVHDEIIAVNNFELDNHPLTLHRQPDSKSEEADLDQLTKLDFTYQLIKHTLNRQLQLTVRRWHSDWELAPHIFFPLSSSTHGDDSEGPLHQSEEELLSPNEDFGPESRSAHRKFLTIGYDGHQHFPQTPTNDEFEMFFHPETPTGRGPIPDAASMYGHHHHHHHHLHHEIDDGSVDAQYLIPPPSNLGFSGSSTDGDGDQTTAQMVPDSESPANYSSSTTTTGCLIAAANAAAEGVITPTSSITSTTNGSVTATPTTTMPFLAAVINTDRIY
ncbi:hypothetical protein BLOT_012230 [Blomia tropicalis]|nr:hypothetical protein BLOT_012230 [Blomia tropicalis]